MNDLTSDRPMDRLVCGDVGYGKTEVAVRAAFKVVEDGYQVAILVPTTVLAEQHAKTFAERLQGFPVTIACLNRFRTQAEQKKILKDLAQRPHRHHHRHPPPACPRTWSSRSSGWWSSTRSTGSASPIRKN